MVKQPSKTAFVAHFKALWNDFKRISYVDPHWLVVWLFIYLTFIALDVLVPGYWGSSLLKYIGVFLCVIYAYRKHQHDSKLILALFLTFLADTVLVWTNMYVLGVFIFCFAQFMHFLRLTRLSKKHLGLFSVGISALTIFSAFQGNELIYSLGALYALLLISNLVMSRQRHHESPKDFRYRCAWYGFIAFVCCDFCVGLRFIMLDGVISAIALPLVAFMVWIFYYPSQVLLANSSLKDKNPKQVAKTSHIS